MSSLNESKCRYREEEVCYLLGTHIDENILEELLNILVKFNPTNEDNERWKQFSKYFIDGVYDDESIGMGTNKNTLEKIRKDLSEIPKCKQLIVVDEILFGCGTFDMKYRVIDGDNPNCLKLNDIHFSRTFHINQGGF